MPLEILLSLQRIVGRYSIMLEFMSSMSGGNLESQQAEIKVVQKWIEDEINAQ